MIYFCVCTHTTEVQVTVLTPAWYSFINSTCFCNSAWPVQLYSAYSSLDTLQKHTCTKKKPKKTSKQTNQTNLSFVEFCKWRRHHDAVTVFVLLPSNESLNMTFAKCKGNVQVCYYSHL